MKALIIEDEIHNFNALRRMLKEIDCDMSIEGPVTSVEGFMDALRHHNDFDVIFADIRLEDGICFDAFAEIEVKSPVIFTTAYDEYALKAFECNGIAYLLKPIDRKRLASALDMARKLSSNDASKLNDLLASIGLKKNHYPKRLISSDFDGYHTIEEESICMITIDDDEIVAFTTDGQRHRLQYNSMDKVVADLDPELFFRANRQYIVRISEVNSMKSWFHQSQKCRLKHFPDIEIVISKDRAPRFKEWLKGS